MTQLALEIAETANLRRRAEQTKRRWSQPANGVQERLDIPETEAVSKALREIRAEAAGLESCIKLFRDALAANTYPLAGRGEPLAEEHRPRFEAQVKEWEATLAKVRGSLAELMSATR